ncbi:hypothetical protein [Pseudomonas sp.]|uniref:hypothetical protein n=1 Tax=Pseudomonas sp. TaxID=306 RepID=UPI003C51438A
MATPLTKPSDLTPSNIKKAQVIAISELIEEEVTLLIDRTTVTCFASYCPHEIKAGEFYEVELTLNLAEYYDVQKSYSAEAYAERKNDSFSYVLHGLLHKNSFETFTSLNDEGIHYDHPDLNGEFIMVTVERIDAAFL